MKGGRQAIEEIWPAAALTLFVKVNRLSACFRNLLILFTGRALGEIWESQSVEGFVKNILRFVLGPPCIWYSPFIQVFCNTTDLIYNLTYIQLFLCNDKEICKLTLLTPARRPTAGFLSTSTSTYLQVERPGPIRYCRFLTLKKQQDYDLSFEREI